MCAYKFKANRNSPTKPCQLTCRLVRVITRVQLLEGAALKFKRANNVQNLVQFRTTFDFDHVYFWNMHKDIDKCKQWSSQTWKKPLENFFVALRVNSISRHPYWFNPL